MTPADAVWSGRVPATLVGMRLDRAVSMLTGRSRARAADVVAEGRVRVDGRVVRSGRTMLLEGQQLDLDIEADEERGVAPEADVEFGVVHEDRSLVVVDKPAGLVVHPGAGHARGTLVGGLVARYPEIADLPSRGAGTPDRPGIVHRLDRGTSGLLVVARTPEAYRSLVAQLGERTVERRYLALVAGHLSDDEGIVDAPLGRSTRSPTLMAISSAGRPARTRYHVRERLGAPSPDAGAVTLLELALETGRTHQIRVHLAAIGHPVVGDVRYRRALREHGAALGRSGADRGTGLGDLPAGRVWLHAAHLALRHPESDEPCRWSSPLPEDLSAVLERARAR
jgi:23S rRNA pseudouridine1911/1915/1917 synthase